MVIVAWTPRSETRHIFSMRKANDRERSALGSDLKKVDAHVIQPHEYDEIPEVGDDWFAAADLYHGDKLIKRGRPKSDAPKQLVSLRLDAEVLRWFKAPAPAIRRTGAGYQARIGAILKSHMTRKKAAKKS